MNFRFVVRICENVGDANSRRIVFKEQLQRVADRTNLAIHVARYPPGCSKYNPIEHRLFPHITRALQGMFRPCSSGRMGTCFTAPS
ncbi:MAG: hypothetical protein DCC68_04715 [Planctomycetota bacterium]|nr:MAG: hypothetical protein DCC68_04715 [Planctomycetota bacterium]